MRIKMKNALSAFLAVLILLSLSVTAFAAGEENFKKINSYTDGQFKDVTSNDWFAGNVAEAYELGLMQGEGAVFNTSGHVTIATAIAMAARIHSIYYNGSANFSQGDPWYDVYVDYALENGIISSRYSDYNRTATRAEFAVILASSLPSAALPAINTIEDGAIPDVAVSDSYAAAVYKLYRAGILTGSDASGTFTPNKSILRVEAAAIVTRLADSDLRLRITLVKNTDPVQDDVLTKLGGYLTDAKSDHDRGGTYFTTSYSSIQLYITADAAATAAEAAGSAEAAAARATADSYANAAVTAFTNSQTMCAKARATVRSAITLCSDIEGLSDIKTKLSQLDSRYTTICSAPSDLSTLANMISTVYTHYDAATILLEEITALYKSLS